MKVIFDYLHLFCYNKNITKCQGGIIMKKEVKVETKKDAKPNFKICRTVTCIHNIDNRCMLEKCELFERSLRQEY